MEKDYIITLDKDFIWKINMKSNMETIKKNCLDIEVSISYAHSNRKVIQPLIKILFDRDYSVWTPESEINAGGNLTCQISDAIIRCAYKGFYILSLVKKS